MKVFVLALSAAIYLTSTAASAEIVGGVGAVDPAAQGTPPGGAARSLVLGAPIANRERIETKGQGKAQIIFRDKSTLSIGQNSSVTIDHFVYDSRIAAGKQMISVAKGALRFVGGEVSHSSGAEFKTPSASIGIRGGTVLLLVGGPNGDQVILLYGVAEISYAGQVVKLLRPGFGVKISSVDHRISEPALADQATIGDLESRISSAPGQTGGVSAAFIPTDTQAATRLADTRIPDRTPWAGLGAIGAHWGGASLVQSRAQAINQTVATTAQQRTAALIRSLSSPTTQQGGTGQSGGGSLSSGLFGQQGFCVWSCVTPTLVSINPSGAGVTVVLRADFGTTLGYFMITVDAQQPQNAASYPETVTVNYYPPNGPVSTNTYTYTINSTMTLSGLDQNIDVNFARVLDAAGISLLSPGTVLPDSFFSSAWDSGGFQAIVNLTNGTFVITSYNP
jgi:hypothetical protein